MSAFHYKVIVRAYTLSITDNTQDLQSLQVSLCWVDLFYQHQMPDSDPAYPTKRLALLE